MGYKQNIKKVKYKKRAVWEREGVSILQTINDVQRKKA